jgi:hypothetical protein
MLVRGAYVVNQMSGYISGMSSPGCQMLAIASHNFVQQQPVKEGEFTLRYFY